MSTNYFWTWLLANYCLTMLTKRGVKLQPWPKWALVKDIVIVITIIIVIIIIVITTTIIIIVIITFNMQRNLFQGHTQNFPLKLLLSLFFLVRNGKWKPNQETSRNGKTERNVLSHLSFSRLTFVSRSAKNCSTVSKISHHWCCHSLLCILVLFWFIPATKGSPLNQTSCHGLLVALVMAKPAWKWSWHCGCWGRMWWWICFKIYFYRTQVRS